LSSFSVILKYFYSSFDNEDDFPMSFEDELAMLDGMEAEMPSDIGTELIGQVSLTISLYFDSVTFSTIYVSTNLLTL
jgi:hypothetical protein